MMRVGPTVARWVENWAMSSAAASAATSWDSEIMERDAGER